MKTLTLRNVPDEVVEQLVAMSKQSHQSMNGAAVLALRRSLGLDAAPRRKRDLSEFAGSWSQEDFDEFARATACFAKPDTELWQQ